MRSKKDKIAIEYYKKSNEIISKMFNVLIRTQRRVDDEVYRKMLDKLKINI